MHATQILTAEHEIILRFLATLFQAQKQMERGARLPRAFLEKAVYFSSNFADRFHHFKEEYLMFGLLAQKNAGRLDLHMGALRYGHELCRGHIREIEQALDDDAEEDDMAALTVLDNTAAYVAVLRNHIYTEDRIFFPMVEETLSEEEKQMLMGQFHSESAAKDAATFERYRELAGEIASLLDTDG